MCVCVQSDIDGCMEAAREKCDALKKDYKTALKSKTKQIRSAQEDSALHTLFLTSQRAILDTDC